MRTPASGVDENHLKEPAIMTPRPPLGARRLIALAGAFAALALLGGCASTGRSALQANLQAFGFEPSTADCIARGMSDRLDSRQLQSVNRLLSGVRRMDRAPDSNEALGRALDVAARAAEPDILDAATRSLAGCTILTRR
jgi:hypothetical protein